MKRIEYDNKDKKIDIDINIKEDIQKWADYFKTKLKRRPRVFIAAAASAVMVIALTGFLSILNQASMTMEQVSPSSNGSAEESTAGTTGQTKPSPSSSSVIVSPYEPYSAVTVAADYYIQQMQSAAAVSQTLNIDKYNTKNSSANYSLEFKKSDINIGDVVASLLKCPKVYTAYTADYSSADYINIAFDGGPNRGGPSGITIYMPQNSSSPTYITFYIASPDVYSSYYPYPGTYACDHAVFEDIEDVLKPYTTQPQSATDTVDQFLDAFSKKDTQAIKQLVSDADHIGDWTILGPSGGTISDLNQNSTWLGYETAVRVSFYVDGGDCYPFEQGYNERVMEISSKSGKVTSFVRAADYDTPIMSDAEQMCSDFLSLGKLQTFHNVASIDNEIILDYILNFKTGSVQVTSDPTQLYFTQTDINSYSTRYFGIDYLNCSDSVHYNKNINLFEPCQNQPISDFRIVKTTAGDKGSVNIFVDFYKDSLQTLKDKTIQFSMLQNTDGSYRFYWAKEVNEG